jgi:hypothetical protein
MAVFIPKYNQSYTERFNLVVAWQGSGDLDLALVAVDGAFDLLEDAQAFVALQFFVQALQGYAYYVAMMQFRADALLFGEA